MSPEAWLAIPLGLAAAVEDLVRRRVSNWIPAAALAGGALCQISQRGWPGAGSALLGAGAGFGIFLVFYLLGKIGGADVKLMAGFGALLGVRSLLEAAFWTAVIGAVWAAAYLGIRALLPPRRKAPTLRPGDQPADSIPYAPSIAMGVWLALLAKAGVMR